jgi:polyhydroxyalkanoate synthesis regulator protein
VPQYLEAAMEALQRNQTAARDAFGGNVFADIAKRNMAMFGSAAKPFTGASADAADKPQAAPSGGEVDQLRAELAALQAKVDKLSR